MCARVLGRLAPGEEEADPGMRLAEAHEGLTMAERLAE
jgi:hypothetical protein